MKQNIYFNVLRNKIYIFIVVQKITNRTFFYKKKQDQSSN